MKSRLVDDRSDFPPRSQIAEAAIPCQTRSRLDLSRRVRVGPPRRQLEGEVAHIALVVARTRARVAGTVRSARGASRDRSCRAWSAISIPHYCAPMMAQPAALPSSQLMSDVSGGRVVRWWLALSGTATATRQHCYLGVHHSLTCKLCLSHGVSWLVERP